MRKGMITLALVLGLVLGGCGKTADSGGENGIGSEGPGGVSLSEAGTLPGETGDGTADSENVTAPEGSGEAGAEAPGGAGNGAGTPGESGSGAGTPGGAGNGAGTPGEPRSGAEAPGGAGNENGTPVVQGGPFGELSVTLPAGWKYELCPIDSDELINGRYGIRFSPDDAEEGYIELCYIERFGVCGTGLEEETVTIAGVPAFKGVYDGHGYWDFISFQENFQGVVALTACVEGWWSEHGDEATEILETVSFDPQVKEGGAWVYHEESQEEQIGLSLTLEEISASGATLHYNQFDAKAPTGELQDGDDFVIEVKKDGGWEMAPLAVEGDYGFHDVAYPIPAGTVTERELDWTWLYGELAPGEYRIRKSIADFRKTADYDRYELCAYFFLN